jgi:hypothetical protein
MISRPSRVALALAAVLAAGSPSTASAQTRNPAVATELFNAGRDLMKAGNFAAACPKLAASLTLDPKVGTMARLAECEEKVGQIVNARAHWSQAVNLARAEHDDRLPLVESEFKLLDAVVPKLDVELGANPPAGASLHLDGTDLGFATFGIPIPIGPGTHSVTVTAQGKQDWTRSLEAQANGAVTRLDVPALVDAPGPKPAVATPVNEPAAPMSVPPSSRPLRTVAFVTGGAGVVALGVGIAFTFVAKTKLDDSNRDGCGPNNACTQPGFGERNDARTAGDLSTGFFIAGGVLAAAGVTIGVLSLRSEHAVAVAAGPGSLILSGTF